MLPMDAESPADPAQGRRGLLFICYQTSITEQFEFLNSGWMNRTGVPEREAGHDLIVGQNNRSAAATNGSVRWIRWRPADRAQHRELGAAHGRRLLLRPPRWRHFAARKRPDECRVSVRAN
jgi:hypothetical protein